MNWNESKSLTLTMVCTKVVLWLCIVFGAIALPGWKWFLGVFRPELLGLTTAFLLTTYFALGPAIAALLLLLRLLGNLRGGAIFVTENVLLLRGISWCCAAACLICLVSAFYYVPFAAFAGAFGLMALLLNAVKNCFGHAVVMKDELDLTV